MLKFVAVLVWPLGIALIAAVAALLARRASPPSRQAAHAAVRRGELPANRAGVIRFALVIAAGMAVCWGLTVLLGLLAVHFGPAIDKPFQNWMVAHRVHVWASVMKRATKEADTWTTWGAAGTAAVCLAVTWRARRWLPVAALVSLILLDKYVVIAVHHVIHRVGPPTSPLGTFPSGGASRAVVFYGLIAYLLWREFSGTRRAAAWYGAGVAALAFNEGYSRAYLGLHWLTDVLSGWVFGCLLLAAFIVAVRFAIGPALAPGPDPATAPAAMAREAAA